MHRIFLAMAAFQIALSNTEKSTSENKSLFIEELKNLNDDISDFLKEKKKKWLVRIYLSKPVLDCCKLFAYSDLLRAFN